MKLDVEVKLNLKIPEVKSKVEEAARAGLRDTAVVVQHDVIVGSPYRFGTNRRSITMEVSGLGRNQYVDPNGMEAAIYSTSGYGGFLEVGTRYMAARPYFRPAMEKNMHLLPESIRRYLSGR